MRQPQKTFSPESRPLQTTLFVSYDGLLDPLGASQIVPYLQLIAAHPRRVYVLSFEKSERLCAGYDSLKDHLAKLNIKWTILGFTRGLGTVGKAWDLMRMYLVSLIIVVCFRPAFVHARGHSAAQVGLLIKRLFGLKLIFDFRGLWVDERVDKGTWNLAKAHHLWQYRYFKRVERRLLRSSDHLVVLTNAVVHEIRRLGAQPSLGLTVIPCCADFDHFPLVTRDCRVQAQEDFDIPRDARVLGYLGSTGLMYRIDSLFRLFEIAVDFEDTYLLAVTPDVPSFRGLMVLHLPSALHERVHVVSASRSQVPHFIAAMDVMVSFIQPSYARMAASPTKLAECFAAGIPVICNSGVGDVEEQVCALGAGRVVDLNSAADLIGAAAALGDITKMGGARLRDEARKVLGLEVAAMRYKVVYEGLD
jgi:glycosyltransferase involved in cell wall biosynthesis